MSGRRRNYKLAKKLRKKYERRTQKTTVKLMEVIRKLDRGIHGDKT